MSILNTLNLIISLITGYDLEYINKYITIDNYNFTELTEKNLTNNSFLLFVDNNKKHKYLVINFKETISDLLYRYYTYAYHLYHYDTVLDKINLNNYNDIININPNYENLDIKFYINYIRPNIGLLKLDVHNFKNKKTFINEKFIKNKIYNIDDEYIIINSNKNLTYPYKFNIINYDSYFYALVLKTDKFLIKNKKYYKIAYITDVIDEAYYEFNGNYIYVTYKLSNETRKTPASTMYKINKKILESHDSTKISNFYRNYDLVIVTKVNKIFPQFLSRKVD